MGSKVIGARIPDDLAKDFEQYCEGADKTSGEILRKLIDDLIYPPSAEVASPEQLYGVKATEQIAELVNTQIKKQLGDLVDERLELVHVDRGLGEAEKEEQVSKMDLLTQRIDKVVEQENKNVHMANENSREWSAKVYLLFQALDKHTHSELTGRSTMDSEAAKLIDAEVAVADQHRGELPGPAEPAEPAIIQGKTSKPGYKFLEYLNLSVRE